MTVGTSTRRTGTVSVTTVSVNLRNFLQSFSDFFDELFLVASFEAELMWASQAFYLDGYKSPFDNCLLGQIVCVPARE